MQNQVAAQDRNWAMAAHLSALVAVAGLPFGHILGPLVVYLVKGNESEFVAQHARASLNYQITVSIVTIVAIIVAIGVACALIATGSFSDEMPRAGIAAGLIVFWIAFGLIALSILLFSMIFIILGTVAASDGRPYTYPFAIRFLR